MNNSSAAGTATASIAALGTARDREYAIYTSM